MSEIKNVQLHWEGNHTKQLKLLVSVKLLLFMHAENKDATLPCQIWLKEAN